jgi:hypothetical protein
VRAWEGERHASILLGPRQRRGDPNREHWRVFAWKVAAMHVAGLAGMGSAGWWQAGRDDGTVVFRVKVLRE